MPDEKRKPGSTSPSSRKKDTDTTPEDSTGVPHPFDVRTIEVLIRYMGEHNLTEIDLRDGDKRVRLSKGHHAVALPAAPAFAAAPLPTAAAPAPAAPASPPPAPAAKNLLEIKSELIGTFYAKPKPDKDDYVKVGSRVTPDTVVCQIEAMKIFNEIRAGVSGVIAEVCVKNGDPVEYNKVLFRVEPG